MARSVGNLDNGRDGSKELPGKCAYPASRRTIVGSKLTVQFRSSLASRQHPGAILTASSLPAPYPTARPLTMDPQSTSHPSRIVTKGMP
jgi:hypothetical protein